MAYQYPFLSADEATKKAVFAKGSEIAGFDPTIWRRDICGHAMNYSDHGNTESEYGWEIDRISPEAKGGQSTLDNLQPLYWKNNRKKGDTHPWTSDS